MLNEWCVRNFPRRMFYLNKKKKINESYLKHFLNEFMRKVENKMNKHVFVKEKKNFNSRFYKKKKKMIQNNCKLTRDSQITNR